MPINCLVADLSIDKGIATPRHFLLDTGDASIGVAGTINLQSERYDLTLHPDSKGLRLLSLRSPLYIRGSFQKPEVGVDRRALALKAGAATLIGAVAAPVAGLIALINPGENKPDPCSALLKQAGRNPHAANGTPDKERPAKP